MLETLKAMLRTCLYLLPAVGALVPVSRGQSAEVWPIEGKKQEGVLAALAIPGAAALDREGEKSTIDWNDVDRLVLNERGEVAAGAWRVTCADGSILLGRVAGGDETSVRIEHAVWGALTIPFERVESIERSAMTAGAAPLVRNSEKQDRGVDRLMLINGDMLKGSVAGLSSEGVRLLVGDRERLVAWKSIRRVNFASLSVGNESSHAESLRASASGPRALVRFVDGSMLVARQAALRDSLIHVESTLNQALAAPLDAIRVIESTGGRRCWLSDLPWSNAREIRFFDHPAVPNLRPSNDTESIRLGGVTHARGLRFVGAGLRVWNLQGQFVVLRAGLGMEDGSGPLADADVTIRVDGRAVVEHRGLRSDQPPRVVEIDLAGAKELEIEVGFGRRGPVQDCVVMVNPALIKES